MSDSNNTLIGNIVQVYLTIVSLANDLPLVEHELRRGGEN